jgi:hypothetical protein
MPTGAWAGPPPPFLISRTVDSAAAGVFGEPNLSLLSYQYFHERVVPLWDPYLGYGTPLAADQQTQPFYPLTLALLLHIGRLAEWVNANYLFCGVLLLPGKHLVRFRYQPKNSRRGAAISGLSLAGLLAFGFMRSKRRRNETAENTDVVPGAVH